MVRTTDNPFEQQAAQAVESVRDALRGVVRQFGSTTRTAADFQRATQLDMKLCWKVFKVLDASTPLAGAAYVPGPSNFRTLIRSAQRRGVNQHALDHLHQAIDQFDELIQEHAGDRQTFDSMVSAYSESSREALDLEHRRAAFRANRHIWGLQADAHLSSFILCGSNNSDDLLSGALVSSLVGVRRLRPSRMPLFVQVVGVTDDEGEITDQFRTEPIDPEGAGDQHLSLLREFCSQNIPQLETSMTSRGYVRATLPGSMVGLSQALTLSTGHIYRDFAGRYATERSRMSAHTVFVQTPTPVLILDYVIDEQLYGKVAPWGSFFADRTGRMQYPEGPQEDALLMEHIPVSLLGRGTSSAATESVSRYPEMLEIALDRLGVDPERFLIYRLQMEYPVMLSRGVIQFPLPEQPAR